MKHSNISATQGHDYSIEELIDFYKDGFVEKDVLAATLRAHQAAVDVTKSSQREAALRNNMGNMRSIWSLIYDNNMNVE